MFAVFDLLGETAQRRLEILAHRRDLVVRLWAYQDSFLQTFRLALEQAGNADADGFVDVTISTLINRPEDLVLLCQTVTDSVACAFLERFVRSHTSNPDVVFALAENPVLAGQLAPGLWLGEFVWFRGSSLLQASPGRKFGVSDLVPLGVDAARASSRALLGSALDEGQLTEEARRSLLQLFPDDKYLAGALEDLGGTHEVSE